MADHVLVTGGMGFIGSHVVDELLNSGSKVRVLDCLHPGAHAAPPDYLRSDAEYVRGDVRDPDTVRAAVKRIDAVSHQAAMVGLGESYADAPDFVAHNDLGTAVLLAGLAGAGFTGPLVLGGSMVIYGEGRYRCAEHGLVAPAPRPLDKLASGVFEPGCPACGEALGSESVPESAPADPRSVYAATKLAQEHLCQVFARESGSALTTLRYHNVYGPRMPRDTPYAGVASIFRSALEAGQAPRVFEDGAQLRDFIHVRDIAVANRLALERSAPESVPSTYNVASGTPRSIGEMAAALAGAMDGPEPIVTGEFRAGDVRHVFASVDRIRAELSFSPSVGFPEGMEEFATAPLRASTGP